MNGMAGQFQQQLNQTPAPNREGVLVRLDRLADSLYELEQKLHGFGGRLAGEALKESVMGGNPPGIDGALSVAENRLRGCHQLVDALHKAF